MYTLNYTIFIIAFTPYITEKYKIHILFEIPFVNVASGLIHFNKGVGNFQLCFNVHDMDKN